MKKLILILTILFISAVSYSQKWDVYKKSKFLDSLKFMNTINGNTTNLFIVKDAITGIVKTLPKDSIISGISLWIYPSPGSGYIKPKSTKKVMLDSLFNGDSTRIMKVSASNNNVFLGGSAGLVTYGTDNVIIGIDAGQHNTTGSSNTFIGIESGLYNTTGSNNTYIGNLSGNNNVGSNNIFIGSRAGYYLTNKNNKLIINPLGQGSALNDTTRSLIVADFNLDPALQKLDINAKVRIGYSLTVAGDTVFKKSDTAQTNGLANKTFVAGKYATIANNNLKLNKSDTTSFWHTSNYKQTKTRVESDSIYFDRPVTVYTTDTIKTSITLIPRNINKTSGYTAIMRVIGDGTHTITFTGFNGSDVFDNTLNQVSLITYIYDGVEFWYSIKVK